jgi:hypothetical protein
MIGEDNMTKAETIQRMIEKECERNSLTELCDWWGISVGDFYEFLSTAKENFVE